MDFGLNNVYSGKVHDIHKYNVKIIGSDSQLVAYLDHFLNKLFCNRAIIRVGIIMVLYFINSN